MKKSHSQISDTRFAGMFDGSDIIPYSFEVFKKGVLYPEKRFPTFSIKRVKSGKQVHFNGTEVSSILDKCTLLVLTLVSGQVYGY